MKKERKTILAACIEDCIHVAGLLNFLQIAHEKGYKSNFLGPATPIIEIVEKIKELDPN
ncbi:MAG: hypothetical protein GF364_09365, partial [Candidatus Lokiarchaeota archaeon]|nr:hypothetical protein [Candidatus Lokiarchaeota archaeon]